METQTFHKYFLRKFPPEENYILDGTEYIIQQVEVRKDNYTERIADLLKQKFEFHERFLFVENIIKATKKDRNKVKVNLSGIVFEMSHEYTADLYELAYESFETDRRFHLERRFDQSRARYVKEFYLNWCREQEMPVFSAHKENELLGYIILDLHPGRGSGYFQIMLSVTKPGIKGKMTAFPLYNELLNRMASPENGGYTKYCGYISSANIASINLHHNIGAKVVEVIDEYIYRADGRKMDRQSLTDLLIDKILHKLPGQVFSVKSIRKEWTEEERRRFEQELQYLSEKYSLEEIVEGYVFYTNSIMEETKYFKEHGDYRCRSFSEVDSYIYADAERMKLYMLGLSVAEFLWLTVLKIHRFYAQLIQSVSGNNYLEIGPGHGKYFLEAYNQQRFQRYDAIDVSETAIAMTQDYMERSMVRGGVDYHLICQDATTLSDNMKYDFVVLQEVLEHIEDPLGMLKSIHRVLTTEGKIYALFPINAPSPAHIFLFRSVEHVKDIVAEAGFEIVKEEYIVAKGASLEQAAEKRLPIDACLVLRSK